jgi:hypothetical protein
MNTQREMEWTSKQRTALLCCFFVFAFASSASSASLAKSSNLSPGENVEPNGLGQEITPEQIANYILTLPPKPRGIVCPRCDAIYEEMWQLQMSFFDFYYLPGGLYINSPSQVLAVLQQEQTQFCVQKYQMSGDGYLYKFCYSNYIGCYVATANNTQLQDVPGGGGGGVTCDKVPFREFVHTIAAYALNGSDMNVEISLQPLRPERLRIELPNSWFIRTAVRIQWAINALPIDLWQALKLGDTMPGPEGRQVPLAPPYPSITEAFSTVMANKTMEYIEATMASWPWQPPPPPPPPTPPPCPGGSLQECMKLCPKTPVEAYKTCVKACLDVCHA